MKVQNIKFRHREKALAEHERMSRLFKENRFLFELERQKAIETAIGRVKKEELKNKLQKRQDQWDKTLKHSGTSRNRLVLMEMMLWDAVHSEWLPAIRNA